MPYHNLQQISDALDELKAAGDKDSQNAASFLVSQIQPLTSRIVALESTVAAMQTQIAAFLTPAPKV